MGLADFKSTPTGRRNFCKRCRCDLPGLRGVISSTLFRRPSGTAANERLDSVGGTYCEDCTLAVWARIRDVVLEETNA